ncbi:MAG: flagellar hook-length control protein FliK [Sulfurospirillum sp.]|nr:flagellar hook-length control protein FliK [Sulfurospirillum sp.]
MKEILNISVNSHVAKATKAPAMPTEKEDTKKGSKDFLTMLFSQLKNNAKSNEDVILNLAPTANTEEISEPVFLQPQTKKALDDHLLSEVLEILTLLKGETPKTSFPKYSPKLEKLLSDEAFVEGLKEVKNISDLFKISQKFNLGLEKISIEKFDLPKAQEEFPFLDKKAFFAVNKEELQTLKKSLDTGEKVEARRGEIPFMAIEKPVKIQKEQSILEKLITKEQPAANEKIVVKEKIISEKNEEIKTIVVKEEKVALNKTNNEMKISVETKEIPKEVKKEEKIATRVQVISDEIGDTDQPIVKEANQTRSNEVKIEPTPIKRGLSEIMLEGLRTERKSETKDDQTLAQTLNQSKVSEKSTNETQNIEPSEIKVENLQNKADSKLIAKQELPPRMATRESLNSFADDLREKIEQYKPPIMKVQMALNPKTLGEVDVTIITRGNNLHVNITSNTNTMNIFTQNQAEFKNSLVNMGFTNLEMNFSDNKENNKDQGKNNKASKDTPDDDLEENAEIAASNIELIVPQYI